MAKTVRNGVSINMDKVRTLRFTQAGIAFFEDEATKLLGLKRENNAGIMQILPFYWSKAAIQTIAVKAALLHEESLSDDDANGLIDTYVEKGGSIDDLGLSMQEALRMARDPSSLASWKKNLENLRKIQEMQSEAADLETTKAIAEAQKKLADAQKKSSTTLVKSTDSELSS